MSDIQELVSAGWQRRKRAIAAMLARNDPSLPETIADLLRSNHDDLNTLNASLDLIVALGPAVLPALSVLLTDADASVRIYACNAFGLIPQAPGELLLPLLQDPNPNVQYAAIEALGRLRYTPAVPALEKILHDPDENPQNAFAALNALTQIGDRSSAPALRKALRHPLLAESAAEALARWNVGAAAPDILAACQSGTLSLTAALQAFASLDAEDPASLHRLLEENRAAIRLLCEKDLPDWLPALLEKALSSQPPADLQAAIWELVTGILQRRPQQVEKLFPVLKYCPPEHADWLLPLLHAPSPEVQAAACIAAADAGLKSLAPAIAEILRHTNDPETALAAIHALESLEARSQTEALWAMTAHPMAYIRQAAAQALEKLGAADEVRLQGLLQSARAEERESALRLIASQLPEKCPDFLWQLLRATSDLAPGVQRMAITTLGYCASSPEARQRLEESCQHPDPQIRAAAAQGLRHAPAEIARALLFALLQDAHIWVRLAALRSLEKHIQPEDLETLQPLLGDPLPPVRATALEILATAFPEKANTLLLQLAADPAPEVQATIAKVRTKAA
jgi:HEAT repeat protein